MACFRRRLTFSGPLDLSAGRLDTNLRRGVQPTHARLPTSMGFNGQHLCTWGDFGIQLA